jgi:hypothetical protein
MVTADIFFQWFVPLIGPRDGGHNVVMIDAELFVDGPHKAYTQYMDN